MWTHPFQQDPFYLGLNREPATVRLQSPRLAVLRFIVSWPTFLSILAQDNL